MKHLRLTWLPRYAAVLTLLFITAITNAQTHTPRYNTINNNCGGYYEYLPQGYSANTWQSYPLIVYIHGVGEGGNGTTDLGKVINCWTALPRVIENGAFPASFNVGGQNFSFVIISPQFKGWPAASDINDVINYAAQNYRIDQSRIYVTGMSMGGGAVWDFAAAYPNRAAAIVPVCGASTPDIYRAQAIANAKLPVWATHNLNDYMVASSNTTGWVSLITQYGGSAKSTIWPYTGHDAWSTTYSPTFTENGVNIYQWMLQYQKGGSATPPPAPAANKLPTANAGTNQTITLPTSSIGLSGSGTDPDGTIASYQWSQASGPAPAVFMSTTWASTSVSALVAGTYVFTLKVTDNNGGTATSNVSITVNAAVATVPATPTTPTIPTVISGTTRIEAEDYANMSGVQTAATQDVGGGKLVGWIDNGDWMDYAVNAPSAGSYTVNLRLSSLLSGGQLQIKNGFGVVLSTVNVPATGGFDTWQTVSTTITLAAGAQTIRVQSTSGVGWGFNWMEIAGGTTTTPPSTSGTTRIEAENYSNMSGIQTAATQDAGGGQLVGWIDNGDWMDYSVNAPSAGSYAVNLRVSALLTGGQLVIKNAIGSVLATVNIPSTGGFDTWQTVSTNIALAAGAQTIRVQSATTIGWGFNWLEIAGAGSTTTPPASSTTRIEAENYSNMSGIQTAATQDVGGGKLVGWIDNGDWMDYSVSAATAGTYTINLRVSALLSGGQLVIKNAIGSVLATVNVPATGGFDTWQTIPTTISLAAGAQTIRIQSTTTISWGFNWMELAQASGASLTAKALSTTDAVLSETAVTVYPAAVTDKFQLQINNDLTGGVNVDVVDAQGQVQKHFTLQKTAQGTTQYYLSIGDLQAGSYTLKVSMNSWNESKQITKQ